MQGHSASIPPHSRNLSTVSSVTVQSSLQSHLTEPLLPPNSYGEPYHDESAMASKADLPSPSLPQQTWRSHHPREDSMLISNEKVGGRGTHSRDRVGVPSKRLRWAKLGLEIVIGCWGIYNTVRYFMAFTTFESEVGQIVSLALGVCTTLSPAFLAAALIFSWFQPRLIYYGVSPHTTSTIYWGLNFTSLFLLFAPTAVNLALAFAWKNSEDLQLRIRYRCYTDIDVVWSRQDRICRGQASAWGLWVILSVLRMIITALFLIAYPIVLRKLRSMTPVPPKRLRGKHRLNPSDAVANHHHHQAPESQSNLDPRLRSETSLLSSRATANLGISHLLPRPLRFSRSHSSGFSGEAVSVTTNSPSLQYNPSQGYGHSQNAVYRSLNTPLSSVPEAASSDADFGSYTDRFSSLVSQIHQETEAALEFARSDPSGSTNSRSTKSIVTSIDSSSLGSITNRNGDHWRQEDSDYREEDGKERLEGDSRPLRRAPRPLHQHAPSDSPDEEPGSDEDDFYGSGTSPSPPPSVSPVVGYNEFGLPYPPDEQVSMMNGYVRRMPTIESVGSREMGSSIAASSLMNRNSMGGSSIANRLSGISRPPTRNTLLSMLSHEGSLNGKVDGEENRHDSLNVQVERLAALGALTGASVSANGSANSSSSDNHHGGNISEIGELRSVKSVKKVLDTRIPSSNLDVELPNLVGRYEGENGYPNSTGGSRSTDVSYHTASGGDDEPLVGVKSEGATTVPMDGPTFFKV